MAELVTLEGLRGWRNRHFCQKVVATNGCFDLLHVGHLRYLQEAARHGDQLIVGLNSDESVRQLKGSQRPLIGEDDRAELLMGLRCVSAVCVFGDTNAAEFLRHCKPDVYIKGSDYSLKTLHDEERVVVEKLGAEVQFVATVEGYSTTKLCHTINSLNKHLSSSAEYAREE